MPPSPRLPAIDLVKGCAILCVLFIHSQALGDGPLFLYVVNQAVPIFVVLFGLNSELWWQARSGSEATIASFYASRARRILVPMWAALPVWWALALLLRPADVVLTRTLPLWHAAGWLSQVGTGWFVTMIIQLVLVFPLLHALARRAGTETVLVAGLACTLACVRLRFLLLAALAGVGPAPGRAQDFFNYFVFSPRLLAHVAFGMWLAPKVDRVGGTAAALSAAAFAACVAGAEGGFGASRAPYAAALVPLPLTVLLLAACCGSPGGAVRPSLKIEAGGARIRRRPPTRFARHELAGAAAPHPLAGACWRVGETWQRRYRMWMEHRDFSPAQSDGAPISRSGNRA